MFDIPCPKFGNCFFPDEDSLADFPSTKPTCIFGLRCVEELAELPDNIPSSLMVLILKDILFDLRAENKEKNP